MADNVENEKETESPSLPEKPKRPHRKAKECPELITRALKNAVKAKSLQISAIIRKPEAQRTAQEQELLHQSPEVVKTIKKRALHRETVKQRVQEVLDPPKVLAEKCEQLVEAIRQCKNIVVYTGAGISTAASIPDYRGPNGIWTLLQKGQQLEPQDLSDAEPTLTHMSIAKLYRSGHVKHLVSQNCDGLHLRSGMSRKAMSEVHGNMYVEICHHCKPQIEYLRLFDVTEKTNVRRHKTGRVCYHCKGDLKDTIVHFGEKGGLKSPYRWKEAAKAAKNCELILCLGTSLKILKKYPCLWHMYERPSKRPKLYIVNLQWTPKDELATLKINGRCDEVMKYVMVLLGLHVPLYCREKDPLFRLAVALINGEQGTTSKKILEVPFTMATVLKNRNEKQETEKNEAIHENCILNNRNFIHDYKIEGNAHTDSGKQTDSLRNSKSDDVSHANSETKYCAIKNLLDTPSFPECLLNANSSSITEIYSHNQKPTNCSFILPHSISSCDHSSNHGPASTFSMNLQNYWSGNGFMDPLNGRDSQALLPLFSMPLPKNGVIDLTKLPGHSNNLWAEMLLNPCNVITPCKAFDAPSESNLNKVLQDHCYLSKMEMQKLSPKKDGDDLQSGSRSPCCNKGDVSLAQKSSKKCCLNFSKNDPSSCEMALNLCIRDNVYKEIVTKNVDHVKTADCSDERNNICRNVKQTKNLHPNSTITSDIKDGNELIDVVTSRIGIQDEKFACTEEMDSKFLVRQADDIIGEGKSDSEDSERQKKRKQFSRSLSVPGWFGKGLNKKKKRRL